MKHEWKKGMTLFACILLTFLVCQTGFAQEKKTVQTDSAVKKVDVAKSEAASRMQDIMARTMPRAEKIKNITGMKKGVLLDVGCGGAYLDVALAKITDMDFILLDISPRAIEAASQNIAEHYLGKRARTLLADVHSIPLADNSANFVISTSSIGFWKNPQKGLEEIYRVLAPGGRAFISGIGGNAYRDYFGILKDAGVFRYAINKDGDDMWIDIWK
ncbi:MAG: Malonyl-(acyl-carrier protein) O-methyltransferase [Syntrophorhabdus sp. PtaU1.Bin050]|nr:MAG: Malonyl-(acyl-carrier protein) O-methyltransferase [Syntrophorhabdus sp. PtaU1.Bin050]